MTRLVDGLEAVLTLSRVRAYCLAILSLEILVFTILVLETHGWIVPPGPPQTTDFASFYAAGMQADAGVPSTAYDLAAHDRAEEVASGQYGLKHHFFFFYPPVFILFCQLMARLPYLPSFVMWEAMTGIAWVAGLRRILGRGKTLIPFLALPVLFLNLAIGQNAFLTAALFAWGLVLLESRPIVAGFILGALCYKPHLALLVPVALVAGRQWRALISGVVCVASLVGLSLLLYGPATWAAFLEISQSTTHATFEHGDVPHTGLITPFGAMLVAGTNVTAAYIVQILSALIAAVVVARIWRQSSRPAIAAAALVAGSLLIAPVILLYDFLLTSVAAVWLVRDARETGFLRGEKLLLAAMFLTALCNLGAAVYLHLSIAPLVDAALLLMAWRRFRVRL